MNQSLCNQLRAIDLGFTGQIGLVAKACRAGPTRNESVTFSCPKFWTSRATAYKMRGVDIYRRTIMLLTDAEQRKLNEWEEAQRKKRGDEPNGPITEKAIAQKIARGEAAKEGERVLKEVLPHLMKVDEHEGFITKLRRGLGAAVKG
jgi:hypothetical protein